MKVLQTLGKHQGVQAGIFQYRRQPDGVYIDSAVGQANLTPPEITISNADWCSILDVIKNSTQNSFRLTGAAQSAAPPNQSLYDSLSLAVPNPSGWNWNDSWKSYVCAILQHEGSVDLYHGPLGQGHQAIICLSKDI